MIKLICRNIFKLTVLFTIFSFTLQKTNAQNISYSHFALTSNDLKELLYNDDDYNKSGTFNKPLFQSKQNLIYIKFYDKISIIVKYELDSYYRFYSLINKIKDNYIFQYKICSNYDQVITYIYKTYSGNSISFNLIDKVITITYPSELVDILQSNVGNVTGFVCLSDNSYAFHTNLKCIGLSNCKSNIARTSDKDASKYGYRFCKICSDDNFINEYFESINFKK